MKLKLGEKQDRRYSNPKACNGWKIKGQKKNSEKPKFEKKSSLKIVKTNLYKNSSLKFVTKICHINLSPKFVT